MTALGAFDSVLYPRELSPSLAPISAPWVLLAAAGVKARRSWFDAVGSQEEGGVEPPRPSVFLPREIAYQRPPTCKPSEVDTR